MQSLRFTPSAADDSEELQRAEVYGLLAALYYAPPEAALYEQLRVAVTEAPARGAFLESSWSEVVAAARRLPREAVADEYGVLFGGLGKPEVFLYGSYYLAGALNEKPLVALRDDLRELGLARDEAMTETEDHVAYLCEAMRWLIAGDDLAVVNLAAQQRFFAAHLRPWLPQMADAIVAHPRADFYRALAGFTLAYVDVETQGFDMLD